MVAQRAGSVTPHRGDRVVTRRGAHGEQASRDRLERTMEPTIDIRVIEVGEPEEWLFEWDGGAIDMPNTLPIGVPVPLSAPIPHP